jgi:hypothetical protein
VDRAPLVLIESCPLVDLFPEFGAFAHPLPWHNDVQHTRLLARLVRYAMRLQSGCIVWAAKHNNCGYGQLNMYVHGLHSTFCVHVLAWRLAHGREVKPWYEVSHGCYVPPCFNPEHLKEERRLDNRARSAENTNRKKERRAMRERMGAFAQAIGAGMVPPPPTTQRRESLNDPRAVHLERRDAARRVHHSLHGDDVAAR